LLTDLSSSLLRILVVVVIVVVVVVIVVVVAANVLDEVFLQGERVHRHVTLHALRLLDDQAAADLALVLNLKTATASVFLNSKP
jgi:hypothetical protein